MSRNSEHRQNHDRRTPGNPDRKFTELEFSHELWNIFLGNHSNVIDCRTGSEGYKLKLNFQHTLKSEHYQDTFIEGFLRIASNTFKMFTRLGKFATVSKQSRFNVDPLPMIPFRKAAQTFYKEIVSTINSYSRMEMSIEQLDVSFGDLSSHIQVVYDLYRPLLKEVNVDRSQTLLSDSQSNTSIIAFRDEIEEVWQQFFRKIFVCPDSSYMQLAIWNWIFESFIEVLPSYLDKVIEFTDISIDSTSDKVILTDDTKKEFAYFRILWSDRLIAFVKRAFTDRKRLFSRQKNPNEPAKPWSVHFSVCLEKLKNENPDLKKLVEIKPVMIALLLENSCQSYTNQFSKLILGELKYKKRLVMRIKELTAVYSMDVFVDQINRITCEDHASLDRNTIFRAYKSALSSERLPETTAKYWNVNLVDPDEHNPYGFRVQFKGGWPVNLILSQQFLDNLNHTMQMMTRTLHYYINYRALSFTCMFTVNEDGLQVKFSRKIQNFVQVFRQVLHRLFTCLVKKVGTEMKALLEIAEKADNFNDLEANFNRWVEKMRFFATDSHFALSMKNLFDCADDFFNSCKTLNEHDSMGSDNLERLLESGTLEIRRNFVLACESLAPPLSQQQNLDTTSCQFIRSLIILFNPQYYYYLQ